jgi:hypothetical protein
MDLAELQRKLIAAAKSNPPSERVPLAFEKRILAQLASRPVLDHWTQWSHALWKAAASCVAVTLLLGTASLFLHTRPGPTTDLSQEFDNTVLAAADQEQSADSLW